VGLITGVFAKEAIVGTMNSLYGQISAMDNQTSASESERDFSLRLSIGDALRSIPESFSGVFSALKDPLGAGVIGEDEAVVSEEIGASAGTFAALRKSFDNDWARAYAYLLFVLVYFPCIAAMAAITREIGLKIGVLAVVYLTILAWSIATLFFQLARGHEVLFIILPVVLVAAFIPIFNLVSGRMSPLRNSPVKAARHNGTCH
jgi:ferrous iron transport protein B